MSNPVKARWVGPYGYRKAPEGTLLETGITICEIGADEAVDSEHWEPVEPNKLTKAQQGRLKAGDS